MNIALNGCHDHLAGRRSFCLIGLYVRLKHSHGLFHDAGCLYNLRKEHFSTSEEFAHLVHACHQGTFNNVDGMRITGQGLVNVGLNIIADAFF